MSDFSEFGLNPDLLRGIETLGFEQPTPIQQDAIPPALAGRDVLACAMTGSGKTAAFLLPILHRLQEKPRGTTRALVLAPTRELAAQIVEHMKALAQFTDVKGAAVFGGVAMGPQEKAFRKGVDVLVATPGRLLDHFQNDYAKLDGLEILVLDEADRMLDMGFLPDVRRVLQHLPRPEQTLFFSATLPPPIVELARRDAAATRRASTSSASRRRRPASRRRSIRSRRTLKPYLLVELLRRGEIKNVLVFTRTKHRANRLAEFLEKHGVACDRIHGNRSQAQRTDALARFKSGDLLVLVATDIAARGIDVEALSHVINFDVPNIPEDYIHRVGRTARAEMVGDAFTFVSEEEAAELARHRARGRLRGCRGGRSRGSTTRRSRRSASRSRSRSGSRRSAPAGPRSARGPGRRRRRRRSARPRRRPASSRSAKRRPDGRPGRAAAPSAPAQGQQGRPGGQDAAGTPPERARQGDAQTSERTAQPRHQRQPQPAGASSSRPRKDQRRRSAEPPHRHVEPPTRSQVDPTTKPTEERVGQILSRLLAGPVQPLPAVIRDLRAFRMPPGAARARRAVRPAG